MRGVQGARNDVDAMRGAGDKVEAVPPRAQIPASGARMLLFVAIYVELAVTTALLLRRIGE